MRIQPFWNVYVPQFMGVKGDVDLMDGLESATCFVLVWGHGMERRIRIGMTMCGDLIVGDMEYVCGAK